MKIKTQAIIIRTVKFGESKLIVDAFTDVEGRMSFIIPLPKSAKAKLRRQFFQPLMLLELDCDIRERARLQKITDARICFPFVSLPLQPVKMSLAMFISEFLCYALRGEQANNPLFAYVSDSIKWLDSAVDGYANFHLAFLMRLSRFLGFYPNLEDYCEGCCFDLRAAGFCLVEPSHHDFLSPSEAGKIIVMMRMDFGTMHLYKMSRAERNRMVDIIISYYRIHIPDFPELKSLDVLRELFV
ncbi:DNA repair protein RecO [Xylanibacter muris]|uniref:DNA repair protein RecO n=1 Tax=Xylanibacter muris TaxID=2736290 RepID=A0ABX2AMX3_9BACT|nr:DNA repair protein RecO C-terminal domain-containing protein [Xylanibacter muris]NPD92573.1 DNA repair protein RecO [Xylanibacter muris]